MAGDRPERLDAAIIELTNRAIIGTEAITLIAAMCDALEAIPVNLERSRHGVALFGTDVEIYGVDPFIANIRKDIHGR